MSFARTSRWSVDCAFIFDRPCRAPSLFGMCLFHLSGVAGIGPRDSRGVTESSNRGVAECLAGAKRIRPYLAVPLSRARTLRPHCCIRGCVQYIPYLRARHRRQIPSLPLPPLRANARDQLFGSYPFISLSGIAPHIILRS